jgi:hypothetical protein
MTAALPIVTRAWPLLLIAGACAHPQAPRAPDGVGRQIALYMPGPGDELGGGFGGVLRALDRVDPDEPQAAVLGELLDDSDRLDAGPGLGGGGMGSGLGVGGPGTAPVVAPPPVEVAPAPATGLAVVDDRRWIDVPADGTVALTELAPGLELDSLVIEALDPDAPVDRVWCARPVAVEGAAPTPVTVRCQLQAAPGRHRVRLAYTATGVGWEARHAIAAHLDRAGRGTASVQSRFAVTAAGWPTGDAAIELWRGLPGGAAAPTRVWDGHATLVADGVVAGPAAHDVRARTIAVYRGAVVAPDGLPSDPRWSQASQDEVRTWLVLDTPLERGPAAVVVSGGDGAQQATGEVELAAPELWGPGQVCAPGAPPTPTAGDCAQLTGPPGARVPLGVDGRWRAHRDVHAISSVEGSLREGVQLRVENRGEVPAEIWVEEPLRPARVQRIEPYGRKAISHDGWLRVWFRVAAGRSTQASYGLDYEF